MPKARRMSARISARTGAGVSKPKRSSSSTVKMEEDQPNFQSMGAAYTTLATECPKIPNALRIERFEARIVAAVTEQIDRLKEEMREGFNRCEKSIATL